MLSFFGKFYIIMLHMLDTFYLSILFLSITLKNYILPATATVLGGEHSGKVSKKFIGNFNFWGITDHININWSIVIYFNLENIMLYRGKDFTPWLHDSMTAALIHSFTPSLLRFLSSVAHSHFDSTSLLFSSLICEFICPLLAEEPRNNSYM